MADDLKVMSNSYETSKQALQEKNEFAEEQHEMYYELADRHIERIEHVIMDEL